MSDLTGVKAGDTILYVRDVEVEPIKAEPIVVSRVARKYLYSGEGWREVKFDRATGEINSDRFYGRAYISIADLEADKAARVAKRKLDKTWDELRLLIANRFSRPEAITQNQVDNMLRIMQNVTKTHANPLRETKK